MEHQRLRPAGFVATDPPEAQQHTAVGGPPFVDLGRFGDGTELRSDPAALEDPGGLTIEVNRSRQWIGLRLTLQHDHAPTPLRQQDAERRTHGTVSDDRHLEAVVVDRRRTSR
jgi:hypothetical protein